MTGRIYHNGGRNVTKASPYYEIVQRSDGYQVKWICPCCGSLYSQERFATAELAETAIRSQDWRKPPGYRVLTFFEGQDGPEVEPPP